MRAIVSKPITTSLINFSKANRILNNFTVALETVRPAGAKLAEHKKTPQTGGYKQEIIDRFVLNGETHDTTLYTKKDATFVRETVTNSKGKLVKVTHTEPNGDSMHLVISPNGNKKSYTKTVDNVSIKKVL